MFSKIFKPKWQHRKAEVRIAALNELEAGDPALQQLAATDEDPAVRRLALRRLNDPETLMRLLAKEQDEGVRESGGKRLKRLLAGEEDESPTPAVRQKLLAELADEDVLGYVLKHAGEFELRETALASVFRPSLLADVALSDPSVDLRIAALARIDRPATLERVAKQARGKDKRVARLARERLEAIQLETERPDRQAGICEAIERLVEQGGVDLIAFDRQQKAWQTVLPVASDELAQRYNAACEAFAQAQARFKAEAALMARQRELCERMEGLQQEMDGGEVDLIGIDSAMTMLQRAWQSVAEESQALNPTLAERFESALRQTRQRLVDQATHREALEQLQRVLDTLVALTAEGSSYNSAALEQIDSDWWEAGGDNKSPQNADLQARYHQLMHQARQRLITQGEERKQLLEALAELMVQLETALDEGQLQQASSCHDRLRDRLARLNALGGTPANSMLKRLNKATKRLRELRDWRRFGTNRAREELLEQMQALAQRALPPLKLADAVKVLRDEWRRLDRKDGAAPEALWKAFDEAAEIAYAPCRAHFDALQQERNEHLEARTRFLDELEQAFTEVDWQAPDWAGVEHYLQQSKKRWSKLGGVEARAWQEVNGRYRQLMARFEQQLEPQRERDQLRREGLITRVERLADEPDLEKALNETKSAQAAWRPLVSTHPRVERGLWRRFKAACDLIYARQRAQSLARREAEQAERAHLEQLCSELEGLASTLDSDGLAQGRSRQSEISQEWQEGQRKARLPRALVQRFDAALKAFTQAEAAIARHQTESEKRLLLKKMKLCDTLEAQLFGDESPSEVDALAASWQALPGLRESLFEDALSSRFLRAQQALSEGGHTVTELTAAAEDNLTKGRSLCLHLELLAGVETPAAFADERLEMQVKMLPGAMTGHLAGPGLREEVRRLLGEFAAIGPMIPQERDTLMARLQVVLQNQTLE